MCRKACSQERVWAAKTRGREPLLDECKAKALDYEVGRSDFSLIPRGAVAAHGGMLKLIFGKDNRRLLGVHCIGDAASELVGSARW